MREFLGLSDELFVRMMKGAAIGLLAAKGVPDIVVQQLEAAAADAEADVESVKAVGAKLLKGQFDDAIVGEIRALLGLSDALMVVSVRCMVVTLLRAKGVAESIVAPLEKYDEARAAADIENARVIGAKLLRGDFDSELVQLTVEDFLGLTQGVMVTIVKSMAIGLLRAKEVAEAIVVRIEQASLEADAADDIEAVKAIGAKLLQGAFNDELVDDLRALLGLSDVVLVVAVRSMTTGLLRSRGVREDLLLSLEDYDDSKAAGHMADAKAIGGKLLKGEIDERLMNMVQGFLGFKDEIMYAVVASAAFVLLRKQGVGATVMGRIESSNDEQGESKGAEDSGAKHDMGVVKSIGAKILKGTSASPLSRAVSCCGGVHLWRRFARCAPRRFPVARCERLCGLSCGSRWCR